MEFSITFFRLFFWGLYLTAPLLLTFLFVIVCLGLLVGRIEAWHRFDALYWALITALTVGYGDIKPVKKMARLLSILIALCGIMLTGLMVAITLEAASTTFAMHLDPGLVDSIEERFNK